MTISTKAISRSEADAFLAMAERLFRGLNPKFVPEADWKQFYFENILGNARLSLRWIIIAGFRLVLFYLDLNLTVFFRGLTA